jgi:hypothetical protein
MLLCSLEKAKLSALYVGVPAKCCECSSTGFLNKRFSINCCDEIPVPEYCDRDGEEVVTCTLVLSIVQAHLMLILFCKPA